MGRFLKGSGARVCLALALCASLTPVVNAQSWPTNSEFCAAWAKYAVCATWQPHESQADCEQARSGCTYYAGDSSLPPGSPGYYAVCNLTDATEAATFASYEGELSSYIGPISGACGSKSEMECDPSTTDCFWSPMNGHPNGGECRLKSAVANSTLTSSGAPPGMIAYDAVGDRGARREAECSLHDGDETACEAEIGCKFYNSTSGNSWCQTPDWYDLWVVLDACVDDITSAEADTVAEEAGGFSGGLAEFTDYVNSGGSSGGGGGPPSLESVCMSWQSSFLCGGMFQQLTDSATCQHAGCYWDSGTNACGDPPNMFGPSTLVSILSGQTGPISQAVTSCAGASPCEGPDCYPETNGDCGVSTQLMKDGSAAFGFPGTVAADMVEYELRFSRVCGVRTDSQTCEADTECAWDGAECKPSLAYALATAANACVNTTSPHVDFSGAASALGTTMDAAFTDSGITKAVATGPSWPTADELCPAWEIAALCGVGDAMNDCDATYCQYGDPYEDPNSPTDCNADPQFCDVTLLRRASVRRSAA